MPMPSTEAERDAAVELVTRAMMSFVAPSVTPIPWVLSQTGGELLGTGSYLAGVGERFLITNEHNIAALETHFGLLGRGFRDPPIAAGVDPKRIYKDSISGEVRADAS